MNMYVTLCDGIWGNIGETTVLQSVCVVKEMKGKNYKFVIIFGKYL